MYENVEFVNTAIYSRQWIEEDKKQTFLIYHVGMYTISKDRITYSKHNFAFVDYIFNDAKQCSQRVIV